MYRAALEKEEAGKEDTMKAVADMADPLQAVGSEKNDVKEGVDTTYQMTFRPIVFSGPAGTGKSSLVQRLLLEFRDSFSYSVSRKALYYRFQH